MIISDKTICEFTGIDCNYKYECKYLQHRFGVNHCANSKEEIKTTREKVHMKELEDRANNTAVWSERKEELIK